MCLGGSSPDVPEGTLVRADPVDPEGVNPYVDGPIVYRVDEDGILQPCVRNKRVKPQSIVVLTPGLVERELEVSLGGYGPVWGVRLEGDLLHYHNHGWDKKKDLELPLTADAWERFARSCDELRIWRWRKYYLPPPEKFAVDLPGWDVIVEASGRRVVSTGYGIFPRTFSKFVIAMGELLGGVDIE